MLSLADAARSFDHQNESASEPVMDYHWLLWESYSNVKRRNAIVTNAFDVDVAHGHAIDFLYLLTSSSTV